MLKQQVELDVEFTFEKFAGSLGWGTTLKNNYKGELLIFFNNFETYQFYFKKQRGPNFCFKSRTMPLKKVLEEFLGKTKKKNKNLFLYG